jgi:hypothetical protein
MSKKLIPDIKEVKTAKAIEGEGSAKQDLSDTRRRVFSELGVSDRDRSIIRCVDNNSGDELSIKFAAMNLYPDNKNENPNAAKVCEKNDIIGVGWGGAVTPSKVSDMSPSEITRAVFDKYGTENDFAYFALWLSPGDIVINKNLSPVVSYAYVKGPLRHRSESEFEQELKENGLGFYREVEWVDVRPVDAPAKVLSTTCRGTVVLPNLDKVSMQQVVEQFESPVGNAEKDIEPETLRNKFSDLAHCSNSEDDDGAHLVNGLSASSKYNGLETVVCTFIQSDYCTYIPDDYEVVMHPSSRSHPAVEAIFRTSTEEGGETYGVQVKNGSFDDEKPLREFADNHDRLFLFSASGDEIEGKDIINISRSELSEYICENPYDLPQIEVDRLLRRHEYLKE